MGHKLFSQFLFVSYLDGGLGEKNNGFIRIIYKGFSYVSTENRSSFVDAVLGLLIEGLICFQMRLEERGFFYQVTDD